MKTIEEIHKKLFYTLTKHSNLSAEELARLRDTDNLRDIFDKAISFVSEDEKKLHVRIDLGVCGYNSHQRLLEGPEEGCTEIGGVYYYWWGGCMACIRMELARLRKEESNGQSKITERP